MIDRRFLPWLDRSGRLSWLKLAVLVGLALPGIQLAAAWATGTLAPKPVTLALHGTGDWAVRFLVLSLLVSPLRRIAGWNRLIAVRRMIGVGALAYAAIHFGLYVVDQRFDLLRVAAEIASRVYLTIGFAALLGLAALGATSTDGMIRRLGGRRWNRLHTIVYLLGAIALLHYLLQSKLDVSAAMLLVGAFLLLMGQRLLLRFGRGDDLAALAGLAVGAPLATALVEAFWYRLRNGIALEEVLAANLDFDSPLRPAWWVFFAGLALLALRLARPLWQRRAAPAPVRPGRPETAASRP